MFCQKCGSYMNPDDSKCMDCGWSPKDNNSEINTKEEIINAQQPLAPSQSPSKNYFNNQSSQTNPTVSAKNKTELGNSNVQLYDRKYYRNEKNIGLSVLGFFFPIIGFTLFFAWRNDYDKKAKSPIIGAFVGIVLKLLLSILITFSIAATGIHLIEKMSNQPEIQSPTYNEYYDSYEEEETTSGSLLDMYDFG